MSAVHMGFSARSDRYPPRGERIAAWVDDYMRRHGLSVGELCFRVQADKRDIRRLLNDRSCGPRLNDALEEAFGPDFIDAVAAPVVGGDRITVLEREIASEKARIAALDARVAREKAARRARDASPGGELRLLPQEDRSLGA
jgi:hypothetical protein